MAEVLILDDDKQFCGMLATHIQRAGHGVSTAHTIAEGVHKAQSRAYDVVFLDIRLPDGCGLDALQDLRFGILPSEVIIITGFGDAQSAEMAIQYGAWDFVRKQSSMQTVMLALQRALQYHEGKQATVGRVAFHARDIVGDAASFRVSLDLAAQAASSDVNVLITGDTGTGKELFATAIHENSSRRDAPFVIVDCTALPESLIGSLLFGHEKGAFTGAETKRQGLIKQADGGTLFLDEIGDMPMDIQKAFLRVLQEHRFRPIGAQSEESSSFRLVAATNRDLDRLAEEGAFRRDLLFRLRGLNVQIPPLRDRMEDVPLLTTHFVTRDCELRGGEVKGIAEDFREALQAYRWPGNVRELANAIAGAIAESGREPILFAKHLPLNIRIPLAKAKYSATPLQEGESRSSVDFPATLLPLRQMREQFEKDYLLELIRQADANVETACRISGLSRPHVYALLKKHGLSMR